jgi:hypothetical protein
MSTTLVRGRNAAFAFKAEVTPGLDSINFSHLASDWVLGDFEFEANAQILPNPELTGTLDAAPDIVGGFQPNIRIRVPLRGSGLAGTAPEWGKLLRCCAYTETVTAAAIGAPTAAASGTTKTVTAATPFGTTANQYRGLPLNVTGDQPFMTGILSYSSGRLITFGETRASALTASSLLQIPINVAYAPTSQESLYNTGTVYFYADGYLWRFTGVSGTWSLDLTTGGIGMLTFELRGQLAGMSVAEMPIGWNTTIRPTPPRWVAGKSQLGQLTARCATLSVRAGITTTLPDNPEAPEGFDPGVPVARKSGGSIDPLLDTSRGTDLFDAFRYGTPMPLMAIVGSVSGNRFLVVGPAAKFTNVRNSQRGNLMSQQHDFQLDGADSALYLTSF